MLEGQVIIGLVMALVELIKRRGWADSSALPFVAVGLGAILNGLNAYAFGGEVAQAVKDGITLAGLTMGIWSGAKAVTEKKVSDIGSDA